MIKCIFLIIFIIIIFKCNIETIETFGRTYEIISYNTNTNDITNNINISDSLTINNTTIDEEGLINFLQNENYNININDLVLPNSLNIGSTNITIDQFNQIYNQVNTFYETETGITEQY
jgi:hypothetical protein